MKHITLAYNQGKSCDHIKFYILIFHGYLLTNVLKWGQNAKYLTV